CLRQRDAPAHTAGELVRIVVAEAREADAPEPLVGPLQGVAALDAAELEPRGDVLSCAPPGQERFRLEQVAGAAVQSPQRLAGDADDSRGWCEQARRHVEQR